MTINEFIDDIMDECRVAGIKVEWDRFDLLNWASAELNRISHDIGGDCFMVHLDPGVACTEGTREYDLPNNFGTNFVQPGGDQGNKHVCKLDDGTNEKLIDYVAPAQFYSMNLIAESNGVPSKYTIITSTNGRKQIVLSPPPDSAATYQVNGLYIPTDWDLKTMDDVPALQANSAVLKYAVLRRINPQRWNEDYVVARDYLYMANATAKQSRMVPYFGGASTNTYSLVK